MVFLFSRAPVGKFFLAKCLWPLRHGLATPGMVRRLVYKGIPRVNQGGPKARRRAHCEATRWSGRLITLSRPKFCARLSRLARTQATAKRLRWMPLGASPTEVTLLLRNPYTHTPRLPLQRQLAILDRPTLLPETTIFRVRDHGLFGADRRKSGSRGSSVG